MLEGICIMPGIKLYNYVCTGQHYVVFTNLIMNGINYLAMCIYIVYGIVP